MAFQNAADLIQDAEVLFEHQRWACCVFLSCIAIEELGKYLMIIGAIGRTAKGDMNWKRFWKRFTTHQEKTGNIFVFDALIGPYLSREDTIATLKKSRQGVADQEGEKFRSLYTDYVSKEFTLPMQMVQEDTARKALDSGRAVFKLFHNGETHAFSKLTPGSVTPAKFAEAESFMKELIKKYRSASRIKENS